MPKLVLVRHGQSTWNEKNLFTGWSDVPLSELGIQEAITAGKKIKKEQILFDIVFTSYLERAIKTAHYILDESKQLYIPELKSWRLNERHYGALQGLNKHDTAKKYGDDQVLVWRRSYDVSPPALDEAQLHKQNLDKRYKNIDKSILPSSESLATTLDRVLPIWYDDISPLLLDNKNVLITAHGNSLRALIKHLESISNEEIVKLEIPTGVPIVYDLDNDLNIINKYSL